MTKLISGLSRFNRENVVEFVEKHRTSLTIAGVLVLIIIIGFTLYHTLGSGTEVETAADDQPGYTVLPEPRRLLADGRVLISRTWGKDPFAGPLVLTGIIHSAGSNLAIIEAGSSSYVVGVGEKVAEVWTVTQIGNDSVMLEAGKEKTLLEFEGRTKSIQVDTGEEQVGGDTSDSEPQKNQ